MATLAPSSAGLQSYKIFVVKKEAIKKKLVRAAHNQPYVNASVVLVFCMAPKKVKEKFGLRGERLFSLQDATISASYAQLAATALGLSSIWIGHFSERLVQRAINTRLRPICIIPIGYSKAKAEKRKSKKLSELVRKM